MMEFSEENVGSGVEMWQFLLLNDTMLVDELLLYMPPENYFYPL